MLVITVILVFFNITNVFCQTFSTIIQSGQFIYCFQNEEFRYYREVRNLLESKYKKVFRDLGYKDKTKIRVEFYTDLAAVIGAPMKVNGFGGNSKVQLNIPRSGDDFDYMVRVSLHELVHVIYNKVSNFPADKWFKEGLAEYISNGPRSEIQISSYIEIAKKRDILDLRFLNNSLGSPNQEDKEIAYAVSKRFIRYLVEKYGIGKLRKLIELKMNYNKVFGKSIDILFVEYKLNALS